VREFAKTERRDSESMAQGFAHFGKYISLSVEAGGKAEEVLVPQGRVGR